MVLADAPDDRHALCPCCGLRVEIEALASAPVRGYEAPQPTRDAQPENDLSRWLAGEPIQPRSIGDLERLKRWCRKRPMVAGLIAAALVLLAATTVVSGSAYLGTAWMLHRSEAALRTTRVELDSFSADLEQAQRTAEEAVKRGKEDKAARVEAVRLRVVADRRCQAAEKAGIDDKALIARLERQIRRVQSERLAAQSLAALITNPDRSLLLASEALAITAANHEPPAPVAEQTLRDALSKSGGGQLAGHTDHINAVAISPNGRWLVTGSKDKTARLWDLTAKDLVASCRVLADHKDQIWAVAFTPDSQRLITGSHDATARVWNLMAADPTTSPWVLRGHEGRISALTVSGDGKWLATGSGGLAGVGDTVRLWNLAANDPTQGATVLRGHQNSILALAISPDNRWLVTAGEDETARLWDLSAANPAASTRILRGHEGWVRALAVSPDSRWLATVSHDATARLWDLTSDSPSRTARVLAGHQGWIKAAAISGNGHWLVTAGDDSTARLWNLHDLSAKGAAVTCTELAGHERSIQTVAISTDSHWAVTAGEDETARLWDLTSDEPAASSIILRGHEGRIKAVAVSPDAHWLVAVGDSPTAQVWNLRADELIEVARAKAGRELTAEERTQFRVELPGASSVRR